MKTMSGQEPSAVLVSGSNSQPMTADFIPAIFPHSAHLCVNRSGLNHFSY